VDLLFASSNRHKLDEVRAVMQPLGVRIVGLDALQSIPPPPPEDGETFEDNARIKAVYYARHANRICLADDSGLEVDALGGEPGVHSAHWAGVGETRAERDAANNTRLLEALRAVPLENRTARFVCVMVLADAEGTIIAETRGTFEGVIAEEPRGSHGFGYDPLLLLPDQDRTSAELSPQEKNACSHRGEAARKMAQRVAACDFA
jgi:XTP/dITP diphosphohydrolase